MVTAKKAPVKKSPELKFTALADRLVVKPTDQEEVTASGIFLPDTAQEKPQEGDQHVWHNFPNEGKAGQRAEANSSIPGLGKRAEASNTGSHWRVLVQAR